MFEKIEGYQLGKYKTEIEQHKNESYFFVGLYENNELITEEIVNHYDYAMIAFNIYKVIILFLYKKDTKEL